MTIYLHPRPHNFLVATGWENVGNGFIRLCSLCTSFIFEVKRGFSLPCRSIFTAAFPSVHCRWSCNIPFQIFHPSHIYSNVTLKPHLVILYGFYVLIWKSHSEIYIAWNPPLFFHGWIWFFFFLDADAAKIVTLAVECQKWTGKLSSSCLSRTRWKEGEGVCAFTLINKRCDKPRRGWMYPHSPSGNSPVAAYRARGRRLGFTVTHLMRLRRLSLQQRHDDVRPRSLN